MWLFRTLTYGGYAVMQHGTPEQKRPAAEGARGEISFCFGLTEPQSGSDAAALTTRATATDGGYVINGQKVFTSGMDISDYCLLVTRTPRPEQEAAGHHQFSGRHQAARHRGPQDQDAGPARHRHHPGVLQRT